ncbi:MAG: ABC transporter ATP-binding protein [Verrucomicrobia bacterium]|nr:ABC transporter ATP-binding protein [Verrucomicrobiota bacterium]
MENMTCGYRGGFQLQDVSLRVASGELVGIIGPNGSGKTTLLRAMARELSPTSGSILLESKPLATIPRRALARRIAVVAQAPPLAGMRVEDYVLLGRIPHYSSFQFMESEQDFAAAERAMKQTGCLTLRGQDMATLSGGERQLALIARALCQEPQLLLLDEPTSYLDLANQVAILALIRRLNQAMKMTVVMVLHDLNSASDVCDRLILMKAGRLVRAGSPAEVLDRDLLESTYLTGLVIDRNPVTGQPYVFPVPGGQLRRTQTEVSDALG